jgi:YVTN family beta-propeller protein
VSFTLLWVHFQGGSVLVSYSLGVDIGATFVAAATANAATVEIFPLGDRSVLTPAAVFLRGDGTLATGQAATSRAVSSPDRIGCEFLSRLGDPTPVVLGGEPYDVTALLGLLLRDVVDKVTEAKGAPPDRVALTHPAAWGPFRRALFGEAAQHAGLTDPRLVTEPEAAVAHYTASVGLADGETVAVYDLGGSTFDATVLRKQPDAIHILGKPERTEGLGGADFDEAILSHVNLTAGGALTKLDMRRPQSIVAIAGLRQVCIVAKEALSTDTETMFSVFLPSRSVDVHLSRSTFEDMIRAPIESTIQALFRTLQSAQVEPAGLSAVLLVGGSSRIPLVARMVSAEMGCPTVVDTHPQQVVALGAAALAAHAAIHDRPQRNGRQRALRYAQQGLTSPALTATVNGVVDAPHPQPHAWSTVPPQDPIDMLPMQRTPPQETPPAAPGTALGNGAARPGTPLVGTALPHRRHAAPEGGPRPSSALLNRTRWPRVVLATGAAAAIVWVIVVATSSGRNGTQASPPAHLAPPTVSAPIAAATVGPQAAIPTLGASFQAGKAPGFVAVSPDGGRAYVADAEAQAITVVDTATNTVSATIPIAVGPPQFLTFAPDGRTLYVTMFDKQRTIHAIDVLDTASNAVIATIPQPARPYRPAVTPDGKLLFVPNHDIASVSVIDTATNTVITQMQVAPNPHSVTFSRDSSRAYTADHESNLLSVIDTATLGTLATVRVGTSPHTVAISPDRPLVANVNYDSDSVSMTDTNALEVVATIPVGKHPQDIAWTPDGRFVYVVNQGSNTVSVIDATTYRVTATLPTGAGPTSIAVLPNGRQAYVSNLDSGTMTVLELGR